MVELCEKSYYVEFFWQECSKDGFKQKIMYRVVRKTFIFLLISQHIHPEKQYCTFAVSLSNFRTPWKKNLKR